MAVDITLQTISSLTNQTSAISALNGNTAAITDAFADALSRSGGPPNQMEAALDMNSNQILNLPAPSTPNSPARLVDLSTGTAPTASILSGNNNYTGTNSFNNITTFAGNVTFTTGDMYVKQGRPWADVRAWGALGNNSNNDATSIQNAINYVGTTLGGGIVFFPVGNYIINTGLTVPSNVFLYGAGMQASLINASSISTVSAITFAGNYNGMKDMFVLGGNATGTSPLVKINTTSVNTVFRDCAVWGGSYGLDNAGVDSLIQQCFIAGYTGGIRSSNTAWYQRVKIDPPGLVGATNSIAFNQTAPATAGAIEVHLNQCDLTGWTSSLVVNDGTATTTLLTISDSVLSQTSTITSSNWVSFIGCELGPPIFIGSIGGAVSIVGSVSVGGAITVAGNRTSLFLAGNPNIS